MSGLIEKHAIAIVFDSADAAWTHHADHGGWVFEPNDPKRNIVWFSPRAGNTMTHLFKSPLASGDGHFRTARVDIGVKITDERKFDEPKH